MGLGAERRETGLMRHKETVKEPEPKPAETWWQDSGTVTRGRNAFVHAIDHKPANTAENIYEAACRSLFAPIHRLRAWDADRNWCPDCADRVPLPNTGT